MVVLITGASHCGKTVLAQRLLERYHYPYLSLDQLKMGLIRSGATKLTPEDDDALTELMWPIVREMIKTAIENGQNLIVEGGYIPFTWQEDFGPEYRSHIKWRCLVLSANYIRTHFDAIKQHACAVEQRMSDADCTLERVLADNAHFLEQAQRHQLPYILLDKRYELEQALELAHA